MTRQKISSRPLISREKLRRSWWCCGEGRGRVFGAYRGEAERQRVAETERQQGSAVRGAGQHAADGCAPRRHLLHPPPV
eukprot:COSAG03_NODE_365_length_8535_cov_3.347677_1_plen_79_part_00